MGDLSPSGFQERCQRGEWEQTHFTHRCIDIQQSGSDTQLHHHLCNQAVNSTLSHNTPNRLYYSFKVQSKLQTASALTPDAEIIVAGKPSHFSANKGVQVKEQGSEGQPSFCFLVFRPAPPSSSAFSQAYGRLNVLPSPPSQTKTGPSLLLKLPPLLPLSLPQPAFVGAPLPPVFLLWSFTPLSGATGCGGPALMLLLESRPPGSLPGPSLTINRNQRRCR